MTTAAEKITAIRNAADALHAQIRDLGGDGADGTTEAIITRAHGDVDNLLAALDTLSEWTRERQRLGG